MDEQSPTVNPPVAATEVATTGKQNLLISLAVGAVVLLIFLFGYIYLQANGAGFGGASGARAGALAGGLTELEASEDVRKRAQSLATRLGADATALAGMVVELNGLLADAEEELKGTRALYATAARQVAELEQEASVARREAAQVQLLTTQLAEAKALLGVSTRRAEALAAKLAAAPDPTELSEARALSESYLNQLRAAESRLGSMVPRAELDAVAARLATVDGQNARLGAELAATEAQLEELELFVSDIDKLPREAKLLFMELSRLETVDRSELATNYERIAQDLGARVVDTVSFETGSAEVRPGDVAGIRAAMAGSASPAFFLVVGYASKTGNFDLNKDLSSQRASATATVAGASLLPGQEIRAVFLGQTDRFSATNVYDDQVCEIWEIRL